MRLILQVEEPQFENHPYKNEESHRFYKLTAKLRVLEKAQNSVWRDNSLLFLLQAAARETSKPPHPPNRLLAHDTGEGPLRCKV